MRKAVFRFHDELKDFLLTERRDTEFPHSFLLPGSIKDVIEAFGVPHPEVELGRVHAINARRAKPASKNPPQVKV